MTIRWNNVFVLGAPHCGSTLLGRLLDSHPAVTSGGEFGLLGQALDTARPCGCGKAVADCEYWQRARPALGATDFRGYTPAGYERVRQAFGAQVLVDLSKSLCWRMVRWPWSPWWRTATGFIYLVRDSRAVIASDLRSFTPDVDDALSKHFKWARRFEKFVAKHPQRSRVVYYEDLCTKPEAELRGICEWIGLPFDAAILAPHEHEHHFAHSSTSKYSKAQSREIKLDERWRRELAPEIVARVEQQMRTLALEPARYLSRP